eukprot:3491275-Rhodomonas_salina.1
MPMQGIMVYQDRHLSHANTYVETNNVQRQWGGGAWGKKLRGNLARDATQEGEQGKKTHGNAARSIVM